MAQNSKIEWTDATWSPVVGCKKISPGCANCYAIRDARRLAGNPNEKISSVYSNLVQLQSNDLLNWTGIVKCLPDRLEIPKRWKQPRRIFVCSQSDLFHEDVPDSFIEQVFQVMYDARHHTYQILTKRAERLFDFITHSAFLTNAPYENVWFGVSAETQEYADQRIPYLLDTPAAMRFVSCEPLLGSIYLDDYLEELDWVIAGGESGINAGPSHPQWFFSLRDQCQEYWVPFLFKQWGEFAPQHGCDDPCGNCVMAMIDGTVTGTNWVAGKEMRVAIQMHPVGKKKAGRILDGRTWDEFPNVEVNNVCG